MFGAVFSATAQLKKSRRARSSRSGGEKAFFPAPIASFCQLLVRSLLARCLLFFLLGVSPLQRCVEI